jgi:translation initiation factor IF-2
VNVSALKNENIDGLLERSRRSGDVLELKANADKPATGVVIEARLDRNRGPMATILIQEGTLRPATSSSRVARSARSARCSTTAVNTLEEAGPSTPIESARPRRRARRRRSGQRLPRTTRSRSRSSSTAARRERKRDLGSKTRVSLEGMMERNSERRHQGAQDRPQGRRAGLGRGAQDRPHQAVTTEKVRVNVIAAGVGGITESDVNLAKAGGAIIVGFHVRPAGKSAKLAEQEGVEIRLYDIIYDALDEVKFGDGRPARADQARGPDGQAPGSRDVHDSRRSA